MKNALTEALAVLLRPLALRVVGSAPRRRLVTLTGIGDEVETRYDALTRAAGEYRIVFGEGRASAAIVGEITYEDQQIVRRRVSAGTVPGGAFKAEWLGQVHSHPGELGIPWEGVTVVADDGAELQAWLFPGEENRRWAIHVQGIRTSRLVTLRTVALAHSAGMTSLSVTFRGAGDGPPQESSHLGQTEWKDVAAAIAFARTRGATEITLVGWSMGAGIALEASRNLPGAIDRLVLMCPATSWAGIVSHGARRNHLPQFVGAAIRWVLSTPAGSAVVGLSEPLDFTRLDWARPGALTVPTLVVHSRGDDEIPFDLSVRFAEAHASLVDLVETSPAPHGWELNVDPEVGGSAIREYLTKDKTCKPYRETDSMEPQTRLD